MISPERQAWFAVLTRGGPLYAILEAQKEADRVHGFGMPPRHNEWYKTALAAFGLHNGYLVNDEKE